MFVKFCNHNLTVVKASYSNGNIALHLYDDDGSPYMFASVNSSYKLDKNLVAIKNWSENYGIEAALITSNVIEPIPCNTIHLGYAQANIYQLTDSFLKEFKL